MNNIIKQFKKKFVRPYKTNEYWVSNDWDSIEEWLIKIFKKTYAEGFQCGESAGEGQATYEQADKTRGSTLKEVLSILPPHEGQPCVVCKSRKDGVEWMKEEINKLKNK